ncbi:competence protein ComEC [Ruminiclostridium sufflavum DSM 19573]|uniref:Competence protein ComEC n=1 Tax=Ruminiclostridium sufflavum DSM 19573 TaxID=1121337 RepID=A0A318XLF2_9FIRM|nr:DNA internalization-related competence protein ComEC/Rec2 [Ruminiclostridium sufflavum]PYG87415.1 competence protein ComEC [Ruminiclostridium sufflavum DSM 19573]
MKDLSVCVKRPLCLFCMSFIAGIILCCNAGLTLLLIFLIPCLFICIIFFSRLKNIICITLAALIFFTLGGVIFNNAQRKYYGAFNEVYDKPVTVEGYIAGEIEKKDNLIKFYLKTNKITYLKNEIKAAGKLLVSVSEENRAFDTNKIKYRTELSFSGSIENPKTMTNPGGFDYKRYLAAAGVSGTVYLKGGADLCLIGVKDGGWLHKLGFGIKNFVLRLVEQCLDEKQAGLLAGMLIGYKDGLDENAYNAFGKAGLTHIMVASGMNVAFIILPLLYIFKKIHIGNIASSIMAIAVLLLFVFVAGFSASVVRAVIMGILILLGKAVMRETDIYTSISAAAVVLLLINPYTLFDIGFQLSFSATLALVMFYPGIKAFIDRRPLPEIISDTLAATIAAQIGVVPITLYYFNNFSTISVLSNLLVVPVVQLITIIGFAMVFAGLASINLAVLIGCVNNTFLSFVLFVTEYTSKIPYASLKLPTPPVWMIILYYSAVLYFLKGRLYIKNFKYYRYLKYICITLAVIIIMVCNLLPKPLRITFLDVGQGDGAFIKTAHGRKLFIDGGGRAAGSKSGYDVGEAVVVPYILDQGTKKIDIVIATHGHSDHTEGLEAILKEIEVGRVILPDTDGKGFERIIEICGQKKISVAECKKGDIIRLDKDTVLDVLNPLSFEKDSLSQQSLNDSSLVLKLRYKNSKVLFQGDAEIPVEQRLLEQGSDLSADILKVGHHGSFSSTGEAFVKGSIFKYAVISVGRNNFGHPSPLVIDRLEERGTLPLRTDERGAVIAVSYGEGFSIKTMR